MNIENCKYFKFCNSPICPLDKSKGKAIWYSHEAICKNPEYSDLDFIKTQKKISKLNRKYEVIGFFTFKMLNRSLIVKKGLEGLNEESDFNKLRKYEQNWILRHKGISNELKTEMADRLSKGKSENEGLL